MLSKCKTNGQDLGQTRCPQARNGIASTDKLIDNCLMKVDIKNSSLELAAILKEDSKLIERDMLQRGNELIALYQDANFGDGFQNFRELKRDLFCAALEDLAMGGITLRTSAMGLTFREGKVKTYISPLGVQPPGNVMFSISLKNVAAFMSWRSDDGAEFPQEELNATIYRLVVALSEVL